MTPLLTINLLRVLFVTFCAVIGANISSALIENLWPSLVLGLVLCFLVVLIDRLLKGIPTSLLTDASPISSPATSTSSSLTLPSRKC
jgi:hypothetical protein